jgi:hypothetical protein
MTAIRNPPVHWLTLHLRHREELSEGVTGVAMLQSTAVLTPTASEAATNRPRTS